MKPFLIVMTISAISIAFIAALFSVTGLSSLFSGHFIQVAIMAGSLEIGKLVAASFLYRYWNVISNWLKVYLSIAVFVLMIITSAGIFGYLSESFQKTQAIYSNVEMQSDIWKTRSQSFQQQIDQTNNQLDRLLEIRTSQSVRLDSLYARNAYTSARRTEQYISDTDVRIGELNNKVTALQDSVFKYNNQVVTADAQRKSGDLGPLIYIAETFGVEIGTVVKWVILLLIFVFDPLALALIISVNIALAKRLDDNEEKLNKEFWEKKNEPKDIESSKEEQKQEEPQEVIKEITKEPEPEINNDFLEIEQEQKLENPIESVLDHLETLDYDEVKVEPKEEVEPKPITHEVKSESGITNKFNFKSSNNF